MARLRSIVDNPRRLIQLITKVEQKANKKEQESQSAETGTSLCAQIGKGVGCHGGENCTLARKAWIDEYAALEWKWEHLESLRD